MNKDLINLVICDLQEKSDGIDLLSKEFFFDRKYAQRRSKVVMLSGSSMHRSCLSLLIREGMTEEHREKIFPSDYDLGNMRVIPPKLCTYEKLTNELYGEGREGIDANDAFETIQKGVHHITGRKMHDHFKINKSTALKVVKTLNLLLRYRHPSLMQLLISPVPNEKFSMSFGDAYPYKKNQEQVWLIADLKAYLSVELSDERVQEISLVFSSLHQRMNNILWDVEKILFDAYRSSYASMISSYDALTKVVEGFQIQYAAKDVALDEELFIHLHTLEYAHFATGYPELIRKAIPECLITPVFEELRIWTKEAFPTLWVEVKDTDPLISIRDVPGFSVRWQKEIAAIMTKAMGESITLVELDRIKMDAQNLLRNYYWFGVNGEGTLQEGTKQVSPWYVIAAFCCVWHTRKFLTHFKPYWLAQPAQGGSINSSNKVSLFDIDFAIDSVPEEHRHIWVNRLEWFADALRGHTELKEQQFEFRSAIVGKVLDICRTNNTDWIAQELIDFTDCIKGKALQHHRAG